MDPLVDSGHQLYWRPAPQRLAVCLTSIGLVTVNGMAILRARCAEVTFAPAPVSGTGFCLQ